MKKIIEFKDWVKFDFRVGEVKNVSDNKMIINCLNKDFEVGLGLDVNKGDKIIVGIYGDKLVVLTAEESVIFPEKDMEVGSRVS